MSRTLISAAQLYGLLDREFKKLQPKACKGCRVPLPFYRIPPDDVSANWAIGTPTDCQEGCHVIIAEMLTRLWSRYDIERERPQ